MIIRLLSLLLLRTRRARMNCRRTRSWPRRLMYILLITSSCVEYSGNVPRSVTCLRIRFVTENLEHSRSLSGPGGCLCSTWISPGCLVLLPIRRVYSQSSEVVRNYSSISNESRQSARADGTSGRSSREIGSGFYRSRRGKSYFRLTAMPKD